MQPASPGNRHAIAVGRAPRHGASPPRPPSLVPTEARHDGAARCARRGAAGQHGRDGRVVHAGAHGGGAPVVMHALLAKPPARPPARPHAAWTHEGRHASAPAGPEQPDRQRAGAARHAPRARRKLGPHAPRTPARADQHRKLERRELQHHPRHGAGPVGLPAAAGQRPVLRGLQGAVLQLQVRTGGGTQARAPQRRTPAPGRPALPRFPQPNCTPSNVAARMRASPPDRSNNDGMVEFTMRVVSEDGGQLSDVQTLEVRELIARLVSTTSMSTRPAIYGMVAERELQRMARCAPALAREGGGDRGKREHGALQAALCTARHAPHSRSSAGLRPCARSNLSHCHLRPAYRSSDGGVAMSDALDLERTATEVAVAAARFAAAERAVQAAKVRRQARVRACMQTSCMRAAPCCHRSQGRGRVTCLICGAPPCNPPAFPLRVGGQRQACGGGADAQRGGVHPGAFDCGDRGDDHLAPHGRDGAQRGGAQDAGRAAQAAAARLADRAATAAGARGARRRGGQDPGQNLAASHPHTAGSMRLCACGARPGSHKRLSLCARRAIQAGMGPAAGDGNGILLQGFNWESHKHK